MVAHEQIQQCVSECKQIMSTLHTLSNRATDPKVKATLSESAHHLDMCVKECEYAMEELRAAVPFR